VLWGCPEFLAEVCQRLYVCTCTAVVLHCTDFLHGNIDLRDTDTYLPLSEWSVHRVRCFTLSSLVRCFYCLRHMRWYLPLHFCPCNAKWWSLAWHTSLSRFQSAVLHGADGHRRLPLHVLACCLDETPRRSSQVCTRWHLPHKEAWVYVGLLRVTMHARSGRCAPSKAAASKALCWHRHSTDLPRELRLTSTTTGRCSGSAEWLQRCFKAAVMMDSWSGAHLECKEQLRYRDAAPGAIHGHHPGRHLFLADWKFHRVVRSQA